MSSFHPSFLKRFRPSPAEVASLQLLAAARGRERLYLAAAPAALDSLRESAMVESVESSNRLEGIVSTHARVQGLVAKSLRPKSRDESQIAGYRDALALIHAPRTRPDMGLESLLRLHALLSRGEPGAGRIKTRDNLIVELAQDGRRQVRFRPVEAKATPAALRQWVLAHQAAAGESMDPVLRSGLLVLDLTC
ncbi:MAG TPA: cell filamentation protein Fic, partial [bacterium]|nr:cell filamentation protein Fic [bacterium]